MNFSNEPELLASFAFESDQKWDYKGVRRYVIDLPHNKISKERLGDKAQTEIDLENFQGEAYGFYVASEYDPSFIHGSPLILTFKTITLSDISILQKNSKSITSILKLIDPNSKEKFDAVSFMEKLLSDKTLHEKFKTILSDFLHAKIVNIENTNFSKSEVIKMIVEQASIMDLEQLYNFCFSLYKNNVKKKKTSTLTVE